MPHAVLHAIADIHIKPPWLTKQDFVLRRAAAVTVTGGIVLGIHLCFHDHAPRQAAVVLAFHQPAAHQIMSKNCRWTAKESVGQSWEGLGDGRGSYGSDLKPA